MKWKSVYLLGIDSWLLNSENAKFEVHDPMFQGFPTKLNLNWDATLHLIRPDGLIGDTISIYKNRHDIPEYWRNKIIGSYILVEINSEYISWKLIFELKVEAMSILLNLPKRSWTDNTDMLFHACVPQCEGKRVNPILPKYSSILFLEPENHLISAVNDIKDLAEKVLVYFNSSGTAMQPHLLQDVLLIPPLGLGHAKQNITTIGIIPMSIERKPDTVILPRTVWTIFNFMEYTSHLEDISKNLKSLPFINTPISDYIQKLKKSDELSKSYETIFLQDRQDEFVIRPRISRLINAYFREIFDGFLYQVEGTKSSVQIDTDTSDVYATAYRYDILESMKYHFLSAYNSVKDALDTINDRSTILSDFLRDLSTSETNRNNLNLQISVKRLTWLALVASIIALLIGIIGLIPEEIRKTIFYQLFFWLK